MWDNAQRHGRPAEYRWRTLLNAAVWLMPTIRVPCSNAAKMRNTLKFAGVPQTNETISAATGPKFTIFMCQSMVDIQSAAAEIRRGKKEDRLAATLWWFTAAPKPLKIQVFLGSSSPQGSHSPYKAQRAARVILPALSAARQTRRVSDRPTPPRQNIRTADY